MKEPQEYQSESRERYNRLDVETPGLQPWLARQETQEGREGAGPRNWQGEAGGAD